MTSRERRSGTRRRLLIGSAIVALHIGPAVLLTRSGQHSHTVASPVAMTVREVPVIVPPREVDREAPRDVGLTLPEIDVSSPVKNQEMPCDVLGTLKTALQANPATVAELTAAITQRERAIMVWNGTWSQQPERPSLRHTVAMALTATATACLDEPMTGPRLLFVPVEQTTVTIGFGSGNWSWRELLSDDS